MGGVISVLRIFSKRSNMWPAIWGVLRMYGPYVTFPGAVLVGIIGYNVENFVSSKYTPYRPSVQEERLKRKLEENIGASPDARPLLGLPEPGSVFLQNRSPSLDDKL